MKPLQDATSFSQPPIDHSLKTPKPIICQNLSLKALLTAATQRPRDDVGATILITGEAGVGKTLIASSLHHSSVYANTPLISIPCSNRPEPNYKKIFAFKDTNHHPINKTFLFENIGSISRQQQSVLYNFLKNAKNFRQILGSDIYFNSQIFATSRTSLYSMVLNGTFQKELFEELNIISIYLPPLREHIEDIPSLTTFFLNNLNKIHKKHMHISEEAISALYNYHWPYNVRELKSLIEQLYITSPSSCITINDIPNYIRHPQATNTLSLSIPMPYDMNTIIEKTECELIKTALEMSNHNRSKAIELLGISRGTFYQKIKKYNIT